MLKENAVNDIRFAFMEMYQNGEFTEDRTGIKTVELVGAHFIADEDFIFGEPNDDYIRRELEWYKSQSLNVNDIENTPKIWKMCADKDGFINSNYGWCIWSEENGNQYDNCLAELKKNPFSRRATMLYTRPTMWSEYNKNGMSDFMCTYSTQFCIKNDELISQVFMRSNDAWAGFRNDLAWHKHVSDELAKDLGIKAGKIIWNAGSLHLYERQFYLLEEFIEQNTVKE